MQQVRDENDQMAELLKNQVIRPTEHVVKTVTDHKAISKLEL